MSDEKQTSFSLRVGAMLTLGFASGLPFMATRDPLQAWMKDTGFDLKTIGLFALAGLPYTIKFLWAPLFDRYIPPFLGRRRGWAIIFQILLALVLILLGQCDPQSGLTTIAIFAVAISFFSACQDIVLDAHRREFLPERELGLGSSLFVTGYRVALLVSGAFALWLSTYVPWSTVYTVLGVLMAVGTGTLLLTPEPEMNSAPPKTLKEAVIDPFREFFTRRGAHEILLFIFIYKIGDTMASAMTTPFFLDIGFQKSQIAGVAKTFGLGSAIAGGIVGGALIFRMGIERSLVVFGIVQAIGILAFALLAYIGPDLWALASAVSAENLTSGMGTAAYTAYMARLCDKRFTATQYSLLSSSMAVPRVFASALTGYAALAFGWTGFFIFCAFTALPGLLLLRRNTFKTEGTL